MQDYDLGRKEFDLLELQSFRRETILQYSLINRTEQLRILLALIVLAVCLKIALDLALEPSELYSLAPATGP